MIVAIILLCVAVGIAVYFLIVRPMLIPLTQRIATGEEYKPTLRGSISK